MCKITLKIKVSERLQRAWILPVLAALYYIKIDLLKYKKVSQFIANYVYRFDLEEEKDHTK